MHGVDCAVGMVVERTVGMVVVVVYTVGMVVEPQTTPVQIYTGEMLFLMNLNLTLR